MNVLNEPAESIRRNEGRGIFETYSFGDNTTHKTVRVILLDVRYHKTKINDDTPDVLGIIILLSLGEEQWKWLENILINANETFILIGSGTQILPFDRLVTEAWFYESRLRLFNLIDKVKKDGIILLSGDIHSSQILKTPCVIPGIEIYIYLIRYRI